MLKKISILFMSLLMVVPVLAQPKEGCECVFAPKAGQFQFQLNVGTGQFFNDFNGLYYLLPDEDGSAMGIGSDSGALESGTFGNAYISGDLSTILTNSGSLNTMMRNFTVGAKYFITDHININLSGAYVLNMQPSKNFQEGESFNLNQDKFDDFLNTNPNLEPGDIYAHKAILGAVTNRLMVQVGSEYYFNTKNERIFPYVGVYGQFKMARIESIYPYTGRLIDTDYPKDGIEGDDDLMMKEELDTYHVSRGGQALGFGCGINAGVEYVLMDGLFVGFEVSPVNYQYTLLHLSVAGQDPYYATNHNLRAFAYPQLTIGFRF